MASEEFDVQYVTLHGHRRAYVRAGSGPVLLLLHGLACDHTTWAPVIGELARRYTVIAPDLLGHGLSDKPRADYSLGGYANGLRDMLTVLGIDRVTVVGHSFGGGIAMQFAYQYPERTERMILVAPGGFGPEVTPAIRFIQAPGWDAAMSVITRPGLLQLSTGALRALSRTGSKYTRDFDEVADIVTSWQDPRTRFAIRHLVRGVIDWKGQIVTMTDRAYLTEAMPMQVIWGRDDMVLPVRHINTAAALASQSETAVFPKSGHFPHRDHPDRFVKVVNDFMKSTQPSTYSRARMRGLLRRGSLITVHTAEAGQAPVAPVQVLA